MQLRFSRRESIINAVISPSSPMRVLFFEEECVNIIILTEAGFQYGFGHFYRMSAICSKLHTEKKSVKMILEGDEAARRSLQKSYVIFENWNNPGNLENLVSKDDLVIIDSYHVDLPFLEQLRDLAGELIVIDDNYRLPYRNMTIINPNYFAGSLPYPTDRGNRYYLGKDYTLLREAFHSPARRETAQKVTNVLITMGGTDVKHETQRTIRILREIQSDIRLHIVVTDAYSDLQEIQTILNDSDRLYVSADAETMRDLMWTCDMAVAAAGGTSNELIRMKCPSCLIIVADNQVKSASYLQKNGYVSLFTDEDYSPVRELFQYEVRKRMTEKLEEIHTEKTAVDLIYELARNGGKNE